MATGSSIAMETVFADKFQTLIEFVCPEKTYDDNYQKLLSPKEINQVCLTHLFLYFFSPFQ